MEKFKLKDIHFRSSFIIWIIITGFSLSFISFNLTGNIMNACILFIFTLGFTGYGIKICNKAFKEDKQ